MKRKEPISCLKKCLSRQEGIIETGLTSPSENWTKYVKQWFSDIVYQAMQHVDLCEWESKQGEPYDFFGACSEVPGCSVRNRNHGNPVIFMI